MAQDNGDIGCLLIVLGVVVFILALSDSASNEKKRLILEQKAVQSGQAEWIQDPDHKNKLILKWKGDPTNE